MPCDSRITNTVQWGAETNCKSLAIGLTEELGFVLEVENNNQMAFRKGDVTIIYNKKTHKIQTTSYYGEVAPSEQEIKKAYAHATVRETAKRLGWKTIRKGDKYEVRRRS